MTMTDAAFAEDLFAQAEAILPTDTWPEIERRVAGPVEARRRRFPARYLAGAVAAAAALVLFGTTQLGSPSTPITTVDSVAAEVEVEDDPDGSEAAGLEQYWLAQLDILERGERVLPLDSESVTPPAGLAALSGGAIPTDLLYRAPGEVIARMMIDAIELDVNVVEGVETESLRLGPGRYSSSVMPGQPGNAAIAGHRTTFGAPFHRLDELLPGDEIRVQTLQGTFTYVVRDAGGGEGHTIVDPDAVEVLDNAGDNRLTLTAPHPKYSARYRIVVVAELVGEPAEAIANPNAIEGSEQVR